MDTSVEMWALVGKLIALVAIPHAAAQGLSKLVAISSRPSLAVVAKTMDVATYAALAGTSAMVVHVYVAASQHNPSVADIEVARNAITLETAFLIYGSVYVFVLGGLGAFVTALRNALHSRNRAAANRSFLLLGIVMFVGWVGLLVLLVRGIGRAVDWFPTNGTTIAALIIGPPVLAVLAVRVVRKWDQRASPLASAPDTAE